MILSSNTGIYIFSYLVLPFMLLHKSKILRNSHYNCNFLSKKETNQLKGLLILIVILHHISQRMTTVGLMLPFRHVGYLAVSVFFFLSGYGLTESKKKNTYFLKNFFSKRFSRVYLPFFIINIATILIYSNLFDSEYTIYKIICYVVGIELIDPVMWFVISIMVFYMLFYISFFSHKLAVKLLILLSLIYSIICFFIGKDVYWYNTSLCFPIGVYTSLNFNKVFTTLMNRNYLLTICFSIFVFSSLFLLDIFTPNLILSAILETISSVMFVIVSLLLLIKVELNSKVLAFFGVLSYEMYLLHMKIYTVYFNYIDVSKSYNLIFYILLVLITSIVFNAILEYMNKFLIYSSHKLTYQQITK